MDLDRERETERRYGTIHYAHTMVHMYARALGPCMPSVTRGIRHATLSSLYVHYSIRFMHGPRGTHIVHSDVVLAVHYTHTSNKDNDFLEIVSKGKENPVRRCSVSNYIRRPTAPFERVNRSFALIPPGSFCENRLENASDPFIPAHRKSSISN